MLTIGVDAHKRVHAAVAIDAAGREQAQWRGTNTPAGWHALREWAAALAPEACWGIEGAGQYGRGLAQTLVQSGATVVEVNPRLTATMRRGSRPRGKSDRLDALAVARVVQQEGAALPVVLPEDASAVLGVLVAERTSALAEATRLRNQLHQHLHHLSAVDPQHWPDLTNPEAVTRLVTYVAPGADPVVAARARAVRHLAERLVLALRQAATTRQAIETAARPQLEPLLAICGVAPLTAGLLAAELGARHFASDAALASYAGAAPLEASSGEHVRHRLNRGGNRQLNAVLHRIALVQARCHPPAQAYLARRQAEGKTKAEAIRALKRYIARAVFQAWQQCAPAPIGGSPLI
jgi:transposase